MKIWTVCTIILTLLIGSAVVLPSGSEAAVELGHKYVAGQVIVRYHDDTSAIDQLDVVQENEDRSKTKLARINARLVELKSGKSVAQAIRQYKRDPRVAYAEPNYILTADAVPNDTYFNQLYGLLNTGQVIQGTSGTIGADIDATSAWDIATGSDTVVVGVVDTGIDYNHPDLVANVWINPGGIGGCPAGTFGYNAITNGCDPKDDHYHGTHVSGTIGAVGDNATGVTGVNWRTSIMGLKFLNSAGSGTTADAIEAIDFAVQAKIAGVNVRVLSNSWGGGGYSQALLDEINKVNANDILFVAAAGNSSRNTDFSPNYPSSYNAANIISVAATTNRDGLASFSNYGATSVDLGAPGVSTLSTTPNATYSYLSGTSMATPHVSGAAALILGNEPSLTTADLKSRILSTVDPLSSLAGKTVTGGRLNICNALTGCVPPLVVRDFGLSISPSNPRVPSSGKTLSYTVFINRSSGNANPINFSVTGLPATTGPVAISPNPASGTSSALTFAVFASTTPGTYTFTVTGTDTITGLIRTVTGKFRKR